MGKPAGKGQDDAAGLPTHSRREHSDPQRLAGDAGTVRVIAGEYEGARGPAETFTAITLLDVNVATGGRMTYALPAHYNAMAIVTSGRVTSGGRTATAGELMLFQNDASALEFVADEASHVLVLAGEPLNEPIVQYGPFVMNSPAQIEQAFRDFRVRQVW